ncbi:hypothetical protein IM543_13150 [Massilia sp. UMI-21]|nr:hypothetical protein IM543_13150 [Massilia sp. UMI-21]
MSIAVLSSGAQAHHNEDWAGHVRGPRGTDLFIIDGASPVADRDYIDPLDGDVVWFVRRVAAALCAGSASAQDQAAAVHAAADAAYREFCERSAGRSIPLHAWPIAALTWVRARQLGDGHRLDLYCLGDCKVLMRTPDGAVHDLDPFVNPQEAILRAEIAILQAAGLDDDATRQARLMPILRARREFQNTVAGTNALCLRPNGPFGARSVAVDAPAGATLLCMTDGFYRLVDTYELLTPESLFTLCMEHGLPAALDVLRRHEAHMQDAAATTVKRADDASAILWRAGSVQD